MSFNFDDLPEDAKRAAFAKMKHRSGEKQFHDDSSTDVKMKRIIKKYSKKGNPLHEGEIRAIRQELERQRKLEVLNRAQQEMFKEMAMLAARR